MRFTPEGACHCGCGQQTTPWTRSQSHSGQRKGDHPRFIKGHNARGEGHPRWSGGRRVTKGGYVQVQAPGHPRADADGYVFEHVLKMERLIGRLLLPSEQVHHIDLNPGYNRLRNLVLCPDDATHKFLHQMQRARAACGHPDWRKCPFCKRWDDPTVMRDRGKHMEHPDCNREYQRNRNAAKRELGRAA
jgi:hypothetical protein